MGNGLQVFLVDQQRTEYEEIAEEDSNERRCNGTVGV